jgi:hypothetical protein
MEFTTVDRIFAKLEREIKGTNLVEGDIIEWIGEALDFLKVYASLDQAVTFMPVVDFQTPLPRFTHLILQVAKDVFSDKAPVRADADEILIEVEKDPNPPHVIVNCNSEIIVDYYASYYRPQLDLIWEFYPWTMSNIKRNRFTPVRLSDHTFFNSIVCREKDQTPYNSCNDEYTIVGTTERFLRFNFRYGLVAIAYLKNRVDPDTGYPYIPDDVRFVTAITYYIKWKLSEWFSWNGREGFKSITEDMERKWLKYVRQAKNYAKMPKSLDDYQNLLESSHNIIPDYNKYYSFFGNLSHYDKLKM